MKRWIPHPLPHLFHHHHSWHTKPCQEEPHTHLHLLVVSPWIWRRAENDGEIDFPSYEKSGSLNQIEEAQQPEPKADGTKEATAMAIPGRRSVTRRHEDQRMIKRLEREPTRHADYLAHEWKLEDIWSSWRYVVARRKVYSNSVRLENASWRTWAKAKDNLRTVTPESLNW